MDIGLEVSASVRKISSDLLCVVVRKEDLSVLTTTKKRRQKSQEPHFLLQVDEMSEGSLARLIRREEFRGDRFSLLSPLLIDHPQVATVLLIGAGSLPTDTFDRIGFYRALGVLVADQARRMRAMRVALAGEVLDFSNTDNVLALGEGVHLSGYTFTRYKTSTAKMTEKAYPRNVALVSNNAAAPLKKAWNEARILSEVTREARDLINTPARDCTPFALVQHATQIARKFKLSLKVYGRPQLERLKAGALLAVAQGSEQPPYLITLRYKPRGKAKKVISLVGKGVTFDSGGLSIKSAGGMETMKIDMSGAAAVLSAMKAIAQLKPDCEVRAYVPTTENMINGKAMRPGDVVRAMNGTTIEVLNTDAEGRLILSDALSLAVREKCDEIIDVATLTGACMVALGPEYAGLFCDNDKMAARLTDCGSREGERLWRMPLAPEYRDMIKSSVAEIKNTGGSTGGAITAALFLKEFVGKIPWAHLDIAGPATSDSDKSFKKKGAVGFSTRTLVRYVIEAGN